MSAYTRAVNTRPHGSAAARARQRERARARMCVLTRRSLWCIVMHVDKAIHRHVLRMLHARAELCTWHRTDRWTPCRFHFPPSGPPGGRGERRRGWAFHYFFLAFCPFFPGRPDFALRFFCAAFATRAWCSSPRALSLWRACRLSFYY